MYVILWEFVVPPEKVDAFIAAYKDDGAWAKLFAQAEGYVGTELLRSAEAGQDPRSLPSTAGSTLRISPAFRSSSATSTRHSTQNSKA
jgi:hypothetical protein